MAAGDWDREYERFLEQCQANGQLDLRPSASEQRQHPRFRLLTNVVWTSGDFQFALVDLSVSGVAFDTNKPLEEGHEITVRLTDLVSVTGRVIGSSRMEPTPMFFTGRYRVRCAFTDAVEGLRFLVLVKDMRQLRIDA